MNGTRAGAEDLASAIESGIQGTSGLLGACDFVVCPPFLHLPAVRAITHHCFLGAQDCAAAANGAFTGDISAAMLRDMACTYVILGHSERRQHHKETDETISRKATMAHAEGLITIICVGETESERSGGYQEAIVEAQISGSLPAGARSTNTAIAYEPVWAIGTGKNATPQDVNDMHAFIRKKLKTRVEDSENVRILYGGSVKPANARDLFAVPDVDGALIGGASLKAADFLAIAGAVK